MVSLWHDVVRVVLPSALALLGLLAATASSRADEAPVEVLAGRVVPADQLRGHSARPLYSLDGKMNGVSLVDERGRAYFSGRTVTEEGTDDGRITRLTFTDAHGSAAIFAPRETPNKWRICIPLSWKGVWYCLKAYACDLVCEQ